MLLEDELRAGLKDAFRDAIPKILELLKNSSSIVRTSALATLAQLSKQGESSQDVLVYL